MRHSRDPITCTPIEGTGDSTALAGRYRAVRNFSETLATPLSPEDCCIQSMPDASPTKWHLAHTTWFFETFLLDGLTDYEPFDPQFRVLFNSYYNGVGEQFPRPSRGLLSRPSLADVHYYRQYVDEALLARVTGNEIDVRNQQVLETGLHHEQQHQELILTDIKHVLARNPLQPVYREGSQPSGLVDNPLARLEWESFAGGLYEIGHAGGGFAYDNEGPRHRVFLEPFELATIGATCGDWLAFINDGGYENPQLWLSLGWASAQQQGWQAPLYWYRKDDCWWELTLAGARRVDPAEPVCHVSYFEADAFARWWGARLPTEPEWEVAATDHPLDGNFVDTLLAHDHALHPCRAEAAMPRHRRSRLRQLLGNVWEWTASPYTAYPGYTAAEGALGEYNGKFMAQQYVLRGGSVATHSSHIRATYRNFFPPDARWQFSGVRLAR